MYAVGDIVVLYLPLRVNKYILINISALRNENLDHRILTWLLLLSSARSSFYQFLPLSIHGDFHILQLMVSQQF